MMKERKTSLNISTENMENDTVADDKTLKFKLTIHSKEIDFLKKNEKYFFPILYFDNQCFDKNRNLWKVKKTKILMIRLQV